MTSMLNNDISPFNILDNIPHISYNLLTKPNILISNKNTIFENPFFILLMYINIFQFFHKY